MQYNKWLESKVDVFWGEIAPCEHVVQIYENDTMFLELLAEYVSDGFQKNESVVIIATREHLHLLEERLKNLSFDIFTLRLQDRFIALDAHQVLSRFMIGGWPDEILFRHAVKEILSRAGKNGRPVRAFGEMVAILWAQGHNGATIQLEHLWNDLQESESFTLYCAYPRAGFTRHASESIMHIYGTHSKIIGAADSSPKDILYKDVSSVSN